MRTWGLFRQFKYVWSNQSAKSLYDDTQVEAMIDEWTDSIKGLSDKQILRAFNFLKNTSSYLPSIAEFKKVALGLVDVDIAFGIAIEMVGVYNRGIKNEESGCWENTWFGHHEDKSGLIFKVVNKLGIGDFRKLESREVKQKFVAYYKHEVDVLLNSC